MTTSLHRRAVVATLAAMGLLAAALLAAAAQGADGADRWPSGKVHGGTVLADRWPGVK